jgi:hypothetical protein
MRYQKLLNFYLIQIWAYSGAPDLDMPAWHLHRHVFMYHKHNRTKGELLLFPLKNYFFQVFPFRLSSFVVIHDGNLNCPWCFFLSICQLQLLHWIEYHVLFTFHSGYIQNCVSCWLPHIHSSPNHWPLSLEPLLTSSSLISLVFSHLVIDSP